MSNGHTAFKLVFNLSYSVKLWKAATVSNGQTAFKLVFKLVFNLSYLVKLWKAATLCLIV